MEITSEDMQVGFKNRFFFQLRYFEKKSLKYFLLTDKILFIINNRASKCENFNMKTSKIETFFLTLATDIS